MKIYIAGPMRGIKYFNFPAFDKARNYWKSQGHDVVSPADLDRVFEGFDPLKWEDVSVEHYDKIGWKEVPDYFSLEAAMERDLKALEDCNVIYLLEGWEKSKGANKEYIRALDLGLGVIFEMFDNGRFSGKPQEKEEEEHILDEAKRLVSGDRNAAYGPPNQDFQRTADMWTGLLQFKLKDGERIRAQDVAWMMMCLKASRAQHSGKRDNYVDAAGYAYCGWRCENGEKK